MTHRPEPAALENNGPALGNTLRTVARDERMARYPIAEDPTVVTPAPGFISCKPHSNLEGDACMLSLCR